MTKHHIEIPSPLPVKPGLLEQIHKANIPKKYVIDEIATTAGYPVLRLPPFHCVFNPIEMVWNQLKHHARHLNIHTGHPANVIDLLRNVCDQKITKGHWENYVSHTVKQEKEFREMDHIIDNEMEPLVIHLSDNNDSDRSEEELLQRNQKNKNSSL